MQIEAFAELQRSLRLDVQLSIPKWGKILSAASHRSATAKHIYLQYSLRLACSVQIEAFAEPQRSLRLDIQLSIPKWGKACGWTARDDAMLMLGVHWHGLAHWENIAADDRSAPTACA